MAQPHPEPPQEPAPPKTPKHSRPAPHRPSSARATSSARAAPPRPATAPGSSPRTIADAEGAAAGAAALVAASLMQPDWLPVRSRPGQLFDPPPAPRLSANKLRHMAWEAEVRPSTILSIAKFQAEDNVRLKDGTLEMNVKGRPPRPRSAVILKAELASLNAPPAPSQRELPEAVYLVHCDSSDTTLARGADLWVHEKRLEARPRGEGRDFCDDTTRPRFNKNCSGGRGLDFNQMLEEHHKSMERQKAPIDPPRSPRSPRASSLVQSGKPRAPALRPAELSALRAVPTLRRRRNCPPQARTRTIPADRAPIYRRPERGLNHSAESPRSRIQIGSLDASPRLASPRRRAPSLTSMDESEPSVPGRRVSIRDE